VIAAGRIQQMRIILIAALSASALALGGCETPNATLNQGVESVKQPVVSRTDYVFDAQRAGGGLAPGEATRVAGWMASMNLRYGDHVSIDDGSAGLTARRQIAALAARYGILLDDRAPITNAPLAAGTVRVVISRMSASVPGCPDYSRNGSSEFQGSTTSNFGCATNANLAAMVANPADLVKGQPGADNGFDATSSGRAIDAYRKATPTGGGGTTIKAEGTGGK
jgi:pilus assembly protein CpaD